ncbi:MAG: hypothetical protein R3Y06_10625 [Faecalibacterium sp.]
MKNNKKKMLLTQDHPRTPDKKLRLSYNGKARRLKFYISLIEFSGALIHFATKLLELFA